jgi:hypothetical protein
LANLLRMRRRRLRRRRLHLLAHLLLLRPRQWGLWQVHRCPRRWRQVLLLPVQLPLARFRRLRLANLRLPNRLLKLRLTQILWRVGLQGLLLLQRLFLIALFALLQQFLLALLLRRQSRPTRGERAWLAGRRTPTGRTRLRRGLGR